VFKEAVERAEPKKTFALQIFGTDLDRDAIDKARQGLFPHNIAADVSPKRLARFFSHEDHGYRVRKEIRDMVIFAPQNLVMDPPFTKLDILSCRNLLIYLAPEVQQKLIPLFHYSLSPGGILFLGGAESVGRFTDLFVPLSGKLRLFRHAANVRAEPVEFPSSFSARPSIGPETRPVVTPPHSLQSLADQLVLQCYSHPAVLVNDRGDILYVSGHTGKYLEPAAGKANWNLFAMAREGLRNELSSGFQKVLRKKGTLSLRRLRFGSSAGEQWVDVTIERIAEPAPLRGLVVVVFREVEELKIAKSPARLSSAGARNKRLAEVEKELLASRTEARDAHEEMQTSQEEFRSANEELQSTNEELQSTNEELTTSKEEMQSLNEELQTVNAELQVNLEELSRAGNDMKNLLNSTDIATLFLDSELKVRRFTPQATKIIKLIPADIGRPITDLVSELRYPDLAKDALVVLRKLESTEKPITARDGRWFTVRIMPYCTMDNRIDGVVITFFDITAAKTLEARLRSKQVGLKTRIGEQSTELARKMGQIKDYIHKPKERVRR
jgi:two-component system, chemotaxis family, CheB/CheR fusion protein